MGVNSQNSRIMNAARLIGSPLAAADIPKLSKSRFQTGLQCAKALYYSCYHPEFGAPPSEMDKSIQDNGTMVGIFAQQMYPGGELIDEDYYDRDNAIAHTARALAAGVPAIFEATFMHDNVLVKCDILENNGDGTYDLTEVKSATNVKDQNITDVAVQLHVLDGAGIKVRNANLMHLNSKYVYKGGDHDMEQIFIKENVNERTSRYRAVEVKRDLRDMNRILKNRDKEPKTRIGKQCKSPNPCSFYEECHKHLPEHPITELPRLGDKMMTRLLDDGILAIKDIPQNYGLTDPQQRIRDSIVANNIKITGSLKPDFESLEYPLHFLDFETMQMVIPEYEGTRPYQQIPFQWSDHIVATENAEPVHEEFLHTKQKTDPRADFVKSLVKTLESDTGSVVVYSDFEKQRLTELARDYPTYAPRIEKIIGRLYNLEKTVRTKINHPDFNGKTSIKYVLPAVVKENDYDGLNIGNGAIAMTRYRKAINGEMAPEEAQQVFDDLLVYCGVDTMSMVKVFDVLKDIPQARKDYQQKQLDKDVDESPF